MPPDERLAEFEIDPAPIWSPDDSRLEPIFLAGPLWFDFADSDERDPPLPRWEATDPLLVEFEPFELLDTQPAPPERDERPPQPRGRASPIGLLGSFAVHLLVFLAMVDWGIAPARPGESIPVRLVMAPPPAAAPEEATPRQIGEVAPPPPQAPVAPPPPEPRKPTRVAAPPPKRAPPKRVPPTPVAEPKPQPSPPSPPARVATAAATIREAVPDAAPVPGPDRTRSDYFAYLVTLTKRHFDVLPLAFLAGRRGETILTVTVLRDGTIGRIAVRRSSGYPDIDARITQMVAAVGRFPPLPERLTGASADLEFKLAFPDALQQ